MCIHLLFAVEVGCLELSWIYNTKKRDIRYKRYKIQDGDIRYIIFPCCYEGNQSKLFTDFVFKEFHL